ncbi:Putative tyrosine phosphatase-related protein [Sandaracinus amylolyticus]|uniref:Putative tyrosine phosphatase-related protein n=2 Tax=Sandaracinus amylolyticus TaxID=927083 RepID=A0A0F6W723_9BACT|nr:Putative tyrosine phosphatase-related protein [Sandaracinus amylolyticus]
MPRAVLITQCIQRDFVEPIAPHAAPPNLLHVGHREASRLLGADPTNGPLAQLMQWARARDPRELAILHVRDWHDATDPAQRAHLDTFGSHCVRGTRGAELVLDLEQSARDDERFVDAIGLADVQETSLAMHLRELLAGEDDPRVAVIGVWTDAKITFLLYDLRTRLGLRSLATSSALTASASRAAHFHALEQLRRVLAVDVFDSVGELAEWLLPDARFASSRRRLASSIVIEGAQLEDEERAIVSHLYRESAKVTLASLSGGFSGARVFAAESEDALGHRQAPSVLKIGPRALIGEERAAFERVEPILGNDAPRLLGVVDHDALGGLRWSYAAMGGRRVRTLKSLVDGDAPIERIERVLSVALEEVLGRFYAAARYEPLPLLAYYRFSPAHAASVAKNARAVAAADDARDVDDLIAFYSHGLDELGTTPGEHHYVSYVHGDLNGANVLVDERENVWLIDFFHTKRGHVLNDVVKLENDLLYLFTCIDDERALATGRDMVDALYAVQDLRAPLGAPPAAIAATPALARSWEILRVLRRIAASLVREDRDPTQLHVAALRYAAHTLSFDEASPLQKRLALHAAASHARAILDDARRDRTLRVDLVALPRSHRGQLGLTICPGRLDRDRDLDADLDTLRAMGTRTLVTLLGAPELAWAGVPDLAARAAGRGLETIAFPIRDQGAPAEPDVRALCRVIDERLARGETIVVHCMGGLGRSGLVAACVLIDLGLDAERALAEVRRARGPRAVESDAQEVFVRTYAAGEHTRRDSATESR